ncbi:MAG: YbaB/EbfC family nucleoid-associated protein [Phycisphaerales bacterium]|nr:YbaB/EbfC family nucleoid-associated protein [Phycisphaerae bacterium]NNF43979.1 YbaB/EbfC family nucleoid-associated protein [Phycisphaerales bacterium]NNM25373.1 YbaB/EbfC family nucleoid-associated protein [Phycisphaerales bacterium]
MFDQMKGMASVAGLLKDLPRIKAKMEEVKTQLGAMRVEAESGAGAVRATADGTMRIVSLHVDQALLTGLVDPTQPEEKTLAEELIVGAVNGALAKARDAAEQRMREAAEELGLPLPATGIGGLLP